MKNVLPLLLFFAFLTACCKEKAIPIPEIADPKRRVLVEELTGVKCTQCPGGARILIALQDSTFGKENLIVISNHSAGNFSIPYSDSKDDFRSSDAQTMADYIGSTLGFPTASINRIVPANTQSPFTLASKWAGLINAEFSKDFGLELFVNTQFNPTSRQLDIEVLMDPTTQTLAGENRLSVVITQDSIRDPQLDNGVKIKDYLHRHVLRAAVTSPTGDVIAEPLTVGILRKRNYTFNLPTKWEAKHCSVVAFVHHGGNPDKDVLQATEVHVVK